MKLSTSSTTTSLSSPTLLFLAGIATGAAVASAVAVLRRPRADAPAAASTTSIQSASRPVFARSKEEEDDEEKGLLKEQLSRGIFFFGEEGQARIEAARVTVVGLGGVGSHAAHMLARAGIKNMRLVDFDLVTLSSLNRHAVATRADVGIPKAVVSARRFAQFAGPTLRVEPVVKMYDGSPESDALIAGSDFVIDAIDDLTTKIKLLEACSRLGIRVLSALGAGGKTDPTRLRIGKLADTSCDHLAQRMRARMAALRLQKKPVVIDESLCDFVFSVQLANAELVSLTEEQREEPSAFGALPDFRLRVVPVLGTSPALFGVAMAAFITTELAKVGRFSPCPVDSISDVLAHSMAQRVRNLEQPIFGPDACARMGAKQVVFVVNQVRRQCAFTRAKIGNTGSAKARLELARWDPTRPLDFGNIVLVRRPYCDALYEFHAAYAAAKQEGVSDFPSSFLEYCQQGMCKSLIDEYLALVNPTEVARIEEELRFTQCLTNEDNV